MLALVGLVRHRAAPASIGMAATAVVALMITFGIPPASWWASHVAPWSTALLAGRVYFVVALAAAVGAGAGYASPRQRPLPALRVALIAVGVGAVLTIGVALAEWRDLLVAPGSVKGTALLMAGLAIAAGAALLAGVGRLPATAMLAATIVVCVASLAELRGLNVTLRPQDAYPSAPGAIRFLQRQPRPFRVQVIRPRETMAPPQRARPTRTGVARGLRLPALDALGGSPGRGSPLRRAGP
jgi:hypothetical protein